MSARLALHAAALWAAVGVWCEVVRTGTGASLHVVALAASALLFLRERAPRAAAPSARWMDASLALLAGYVATMVAGPKLLALTCALLALGVVLAAHTRAPERALGLVVLLSSAAPVLDVLQALVGTPLRLALASLAAGLLRAAGLAVEASGVALVDGARTIFVDPTCSGVRFLGTGYLLAGLLAALLRLRARDTLALVALALVAACAANVLRSTSLVLLERLSAPGARAPWVHSGVGVVSFVLACLPLVFVALRRARNA
ncbi:MAG: archaeosortase/exosortase family protein [Planctomycetota bacterium]